MPQTFKQRLDSSGFVEINGHAASDPSTADGIVASLPDGAVDLAGRRNVSALIAGAGAADTPVGFRVLLYTPFKNAGGEIQGWLRRVYCSGTAALGTATGAAGAALGTDLKLADDFTETSTDYEAHLQAAFDKGDAYFEPGSNGIAEISIGEVGNATAIYVETWDADAESRAFVCAGS
jgi:hypothetical protein